MPAGEVADELRPVGKVLPNVVIVDSLLDQLMGSNELVDGGGRSVRAAEERFSVDLTDDLSVAFDGRVGAYHLQVKDEPARGDRIDHVAQDVHDVLRFHSSE